MVKFKFSRKLRKTIVHQNYWVYKSILDYINSDPIPAFIICISDNKSGSSKVSFLQQIFSIDVFYRVDLILLYISNSGKGRIALRIGSYYGALGCSTTF